MPRQSSTPAHYCHFPGCQRFYRAHGLCPGHYYQLRQGQALRPLRPVGSSHINHGYRVIWVDGRSWLEHRWVWTQAHGAIPPGHAVHHRNGKRTDNRLENLYLMSASAHKTHHAQTDVRHLVCPACGGAFTTHAYRQIYCTYACWNTVRNARRRVTKV